MIFIISVCIHATRSQYWSVSTLKDREWELVCLTRRWTRAVEWPLWRAATLELDTRPPRDWLCWEHTSSLRAGARREPEMLVVACRTPCPLNEWAWDLRTCICLIWASSVFEFADVRHASASYIWLPFLWMWARRSDPDHPSLVSSISHLFSHTCEYHWCNIMQIQALLLAIHMQTFLVWKQVSYAWNVRSTEINIMPYYIYSLQLPGCLSLLHYVIFARVFPS